jgi:threonine/homoserine/homoserine lactone efflux protein
MGAFFKGVLMGLTITVSLGPGFIALFQTSIMRGVKAGFVLAVGILISDLTLISISYLGLANLLHQGNTMIMGIIAGAILIITGAIPFVRKSAVKLDDPNQLPDMKSRLPKLLIKGFILNIANPFCLMFWIGIIGFAASNYGMHSYGFFIFFAGLMITAFTSDLLKCYLSGFFRKILTSKAITILNKGVGLVLMLVGLIVIYKVSFYY